MPKTFLLLFHWSSASVSPCQRVSVSLWDVWRPQPNSNTTAQQALRKAVIRQAAGAQRLNSNQHKAMTDGKVWGNPSNRKKKRVVLRLVRTGPVNIFLEVELMWRSNATKPRRHPHWETSHPSQSANLKEKGKNGRVAERQSAIQQLANFATLLQRVRRSRTLRWDSFFFFLRLWGAGSRPEEVKMSQFVIVNGPICGLACSEISIRFRQAFSSHICHISPKQQQQEEAVKRQVQWGRTLTCASLHVDTSPNVSPETQWNFILTIRANKYNCERWNYMWRFLQQHRRLWVIWQF